MKETARTVRAMLVLAVVFLEPVTEAQTVTLTAGRLASYRNTDGTASDKATVKVVRDPGVAAPLADPSCPHPDAVLRLRDDDQEIIFTLPCANWSPSGKGYRYSDKTGPIRLILYSEGRLIVKAKGDAYGAAPLAGPSAFIEVALDFGAVDYCGRFPGPGAVTRRNDPDKVAYGGPSTDCVVPTATPTATPTPPPFPPLPCTGGDDPVSTQTPRPRWVVCEADTSTAWVSSDVPVGQYRADLICQSLGYAAVRQWGGNSGSVCGVGEISSCSSPGTRSFNCSGYLGPGPLLGNTVHWECGMALPTPPICP